MKKIILTLLILLPLIVLSDNYTSIATGDWDIITTWLDNLIPDTGKENTITIKSGHTVTASNLSFKKATLIIIEDGATLIINTLDVDIDAAETAKDFTLDVNTGGNVQINGDFTIKQNAELNIEGDVSVDGNLTLGNDASIVVDVDGTNGGTLDITGDLTAGNGSEILGVGLVTVGGSIAPESLATDSQLPIELLYFDGYYVHPNNYCM